MSARKTYEAAFACGDLTELKALTSMQAHRQEALPWAILAHALTGELQAVLWHQRWLEDKRLKFAPSQQAMIQFALGVAHTRVSKYAEARRFFASNWVYRRGDAGAQFFLMQGLGFYRFFTGSFAQSAAYAEKALEVATQSDFAFGRLISEELMAHSFIENGEIRRGLKHFKRTLEFAQKQKHSSLSKSTRLFILLNQARFGTDTESVRKLENALAKLHPQDFYSRNAVKLELANQYILRGQAGRAAGVLEEAFDSIYASQNRRQIAQLNFRLSFLTWLRGRREEALHLLKSAELQLHREVDVSLWERMRGLRERIETGEWRGARPARAFGEDRIADLYNQVLSQDRLALKTILDLELYYFLYPYYKIESGQKALIFDLLPRGAIKIDHGNVSIVEQGLSRVLRRILEALSFSHQSKADLIRLVWGYQYDPARHDTLVYTSISKLRRLLGDSGTWIEMDEKGYRLQSGVRIRTQDTLERALVEKAESVMTTFHLRSGSNLGVRQLRILAAFDKKGCEAIGVEDVMRDFSVSRASATRDLSALVEEGYLHRLGKARATRYVRKGESL